MDATHYRQKAVDWKLSIKAVSLTSIFHGSLRRVFYTTVYVCGKEEELRRISLDYGVLLICLILNAIYRIMYQAERS